MIDRIVNILFDLTARALSTVLRHTTLDRIREFGQSVRWYAARRTFGSIGPGSRIDSPFFLQNPRNIHIGRNFSARSNFVLEAIEVYEGVRYSPKIVFGNNVSFYHNCHVGCINRIEIGDNVLLASRVYIADHAHGTTTGEDWDKPPVFRKLVSKGPVIIKNNVWVGEGVAIMPGITIGENAVIGANSVVTKDIPGNCVAAGVPAVVIRQIR